jgi:hypothetical protein
MRAKKYVRQKARNDKNPLDDPINIPIGTVGPPVRHLYYVQYSPTTQTAQNPAKACQTLPPAID